MSIGSFTYSAPTAQTWSADAVQGAIPLELDEPPAVLRRVVEVFVYIPVIVSAFLGVLGLSQIRFFGGGVAFASTLLTIFTVLLSGHRPPLSVWFGVIIWLCANLSQSIGNGQTPVTGPGLPMLLFHIGTLLGTWYIILNPAAERRMFFFYSALMVTLAVMGGQYMRSHASVERLELEGVGGLMANPNSIGYMTGLFGVAMLFRSLRERAVLRPVLWILTLVMFVLLMRTVSRTALVLFAVGVMAFLVTVMAGRGMRVSGLIFLCVVVLFASQFAYLVADQLIYYQKRVRVDTEGRLGVFSMATLTDFMNTFVFGRGPERAIASATGITPHNTFIYMHLAFGGITAYPYLLWLSILGMRILRMLKSPDLPLDIKAFVVAIYLMAIGGEGTNNINFTLYSSVYAWAIIEKYTAMYSRRAMEQRAAAQGGVPESSDTGAIDFHPVRGRRARAL